MPLSTRALLAAVVAALSLAGAASTARAQNCPQNKTCFYVPPQMPAPPHAVTWDIVLAAATGTVSGTYTFPGQSAQPFTATAGTPVFVPLSTTTGVASAYAVAETRGVFVVADAPQLSVVAREISGPWNSSATIKDHNTALGTRFRVGGYTLDEAGSFPTTGHDVVIFYAPLGATVTVTPPAGVAWGDGLAAGVRVIILAPQQTYLLRTLSGGCGYDLTGALVTADAPISVVSGGRGWGGSGGCEPTSATGCGDDGLDNLIPTSGLGTVYAVDAYPAPDGDRVTVVADSADTEVWINGALTTTLQPGQKYRFANTSLTLIETSAPAYVFQDAGEDRCEHGMSIIPPLSFAASGGAQTLAFNVHGSGEISAFLPTAQVGSLLIDGAAPVGASSATVPGLPTVTRVRVPLAGGNHAVSAAGDFQLGLVSQNTAAGGTGLFAYYNRFRVPGCGDDTLDASEACDDGNVVDGDGCSAACRFEVGYGPCDDDGQCVASGRCDLDTGLCVGRCNDDADCDDGDGCTADSCNTFTGACQTTPLASGASCDDGLFCTEDTVCSAQGECLGAPLSCGPPADYCDEALCDEDANQCVEQGRSCASERHYLFGVVSDGGDPPTYGSIRCWRVGGVVQCDMSGGELVVGPPVCE
jgi:cysteine-rich repeat protein